VVPLPALVVAVAVVVAGGCDGRRPRDPRLSSPPLAVAPHAL